MLWELDCSQDEVKAPVSHLNVAQLKDGASESCVLIREDSTFELYKFSPPPGQHTAASQPSLVSFIKDSETVTGSIVGNITSAARREILFTCYSGAVKSLVDRRQARKLGATTEDTTQITDA